MCSVQVANTYVDVDPFVARQRDLGAYNDQTDACCRRNWVTRRRLRRRLLLIPSTTARRLHFTYARAYVARYLCGLRSILWFNLSVRWCTYTADMCVCVCVWRPDVLAYIHVSCVVGKDWWMDGSSDRSRPCTGKRGHAHADQKPSQPASRG
jgi:hypothetical protein